MKILLLIAIIFLTAGFVAKRETYPLPERNIQQQAQMDADDMMIRKAEREASKAMQEYQIAVIEYGNKKASR